MTGGPAADPEVVAGRRSALEAIRSGTAREVLIATGARATSGLREVVDAAASAGVPVRRVAPGTVASLAGPATHQGVVARIALPGELSESDLENHPWPDDALVVALDGVTDPHNVGAVARTAEAAGAAALVLRRRRGAGKTPAAVRASAGALLHLPVAPVANIARALDRLKRARFWVAGLEAGSARSIGAAEAPASRLVLVLGSEERGLSRLVRESCDEVLSIPMRGRVSSLNVSVAAGVALFGYALRGKETPEGSGDRDGRP